MNKFYRWEARSLILQLKVRPKAHRFVIGAVVGEYLQVDIPAVPQDGKATKMLLRELAREFDVRCVDVELIRGAFTSHKVVKIKAPGRLPTIIEPAG